MTNEQEELERQNKLEYERVLLMSIEKFIIKYEMLMLIASQKVKNAKFSEKPIFIASMQKIASPHCIIEPETHGTDWFLYIDRYEFLHESEIFNAASIDNINKGYKSCDTHINIILLEEKCTRFISYEVKKSTLN